MPLVLLLIQLFFVNSAFGEELYEPYLSARAFGMGGAYVNATNDKEALFFNPAGLNKIRGFHIDVVDFQLGTDALTIYQEYQKLGSASDFQTNIRNFYGKKLWVGLSDYLGFSMPGFAFGAYDFLNLGFLLNNPAYPNLNLNLTNDLGIGAGMGFSPFPSDVFRLGLGVKRITRYGTRVPFGPSTLATLTNSELTNLVNNYGVGYAADAAMMFEIPFGIRPSLAAVWRDVGQTKFTNVSGTRVIPINDNNIVIGLGAEVDAKVLTIRPGFEYRWLNLYTEQFGKKLHMGVEFEFPLISLRGGFYQGYYTYGVGIHFLYFKLEAASYATELGAYPGQEPDRRYIVQVNLDLNIDPNLSFGKGGGTSKRYYRR